MMTSKRLNILQFQYRDRALELEKQYNVEHPIRWVDDFSKFNDQKTNFFEGNVANYSKGSLSFDDDF